MKSAMDFVVDVWHLILVPVVMAVLALTVTAASEWDGATQGSKWIVVAVLLVLYYVGTCITYALLTEK